MASAGLGFNASGTIGVLLIGGLISAILYGITSTQTILYFQFGRGDWWLVKVAVPCLWLLDTFDMCLIFHILYWYLISNYGNSLSLENPVWSIIMHVLVTSVTQTVVRGMFATRIWRLSHGNWIIVLLISIVSLTDLVTCLIITVKAFHTTFAGLQKLSALVYLEFAAGFAGDALVAASLCYILHRSRTGFRRTETVITLLTMYIINTGKSCLFTALTASISLILFASQPNSFVYIAVYFQLSKLYVNAYLAMLNARDKMRNKLSEPLTLPSIPLSVSMSESRNRACTGTSAANTVLELLLTRITALTGGRQRDSDVQGFRGGLGIFDVQEEARRTRQVNLAVKA
ncbi:hypothetical protein BC835DRAFT_1411720 [Cytidiella melzeri]|nr:hypothetical protein BC835DRAFT_1411720 [Cytidiella melzeri]